MNGINQSATGQGILNPGGYRDRVTDIHALIKRKENFPYTQGNSESRAVFAKSYMTNGLMGKYLRISSHIRKPFVIYDFATARL
jgi:hypothetical protein